MKLSRRRDPYAGMILDPNYKRTTVQEAWLTNPWRPGDKPRVHWLALLRSLWRWRVPAPRYLLMAWKIARRHQRKWKR